jgi:hypothetical protein
MGVGKSAKYTPGKHDGMWRFLQKESGVCVAQTRRGELSETYWIDHNAGDGEIAHGDEWERACSPGMLIHHQQYQLIPSTTVLYEIDPATYFRLVENLRYRLGRIGLEFNEDQNQVWWVGKSPHTDALMSVIARCQDARQAEIPDWLTSHSAAISINDPNGARGWSVRESFAAEFKARGVWRYRMFSALGFNADGSKRAAKDKRLVSYGHFEAVISQLPSYRDLVLFVTKGADQWAYLIETPARWGVEGFPGADRFSYNRNRDSFFSALDRLVLTRAEVTAQQQPSLFEETR